MSLRLKTSELPKIRTSMWKDQNFMCPLCGNPVLKGQEVLDHDHETGHIRQVLHRQCNQVEGRVLSWITRTGQDVNPKEFLENMIKYWSVDYLCNPLHPTHLTEKEEQIKKLRKKIKSLKTDKGKSKYLEQLQELMNE